MQIEIKIDSDCREPKLILYTDKMTEEIQHLLKKLTEETPHLLTGFRDNALAVLEQPEIIRIYTAAGKVYGTTSQGDYVLRLRLYELEERLDKTCFVRISNSEIINLKKVKGFDLSFTGTICVTLWGGTVTYVSRRYVAKIKQVLGI